MNKDNTIIIVDWDDSMFPTSWFTSISKDSKTSLDWIKILEPLDVMLYSFFTQILEIGHVYIVTYAYPTWVNMCFSMLPRAQKLQSEIPVISGRSDHKRSFSIDGFTQKKYIFKSIAEHFIGARQIISIGDDQAEYNALVELDSKSAYLKAIKLTKNPSYFVLLDQLNTLNSCMKNIYNSRKHLDLLFADHESSDTGRQSK
jgi:hypothetical protein